MSLSGLRIVLVDDEMTARETVGAMLRALGADVVELDSGPRTLEFLATADRLPDLVLCDLVMPRMSGLQLAARLREDPRYRGVPLVALTGLPSTDAQFLIWAQRFRGLVTKPVTLGDLRELRRLIGGTA